MTEHLARYIAGRNWAERVQDTTSLPHRVLRIDENGDIDVRKRSPFGDEAPILQISRAELALLAREARRAARRRLWARMTGRR